MINYCYLYIDFSEIISILSLLFTIWIALKIHKEATHNQAKAKQMETMCSLVEHLNKSKISIAFWRKNEQSGSGIGSNISFNIFEIGALYKNGENDDQSFNTSFEDFDDEIVTFNSNHKQIIENIKDFIDNPFIPKNIADELMNFYVVETTKIIMSKEHIRFVLLNPIMSFDNFDDYSTSDISSGKALALFTWLNLKVHSCNLTNEISSWFLKNGIKDFNIRIDFKNRS